MKLELLRTFVKVVQTQNFGETARQLKLSQPAVTQRIQALENHFGTQLLERKADGIQLTPCGLIVYEKSLEILRLWDELCHSLCGDTIQGQLRIGASTIPSQYLLPSLLSSFQKQYPLIRFHMRVSGSEQVQDWLISGKIDVAVTGKPQRHPLLISKPLVEDELWLIAPIGWEISPIQSLEQLLQYPWILREPESDTRRTWEEKFSEQGIAPDALQANAVMENTEAVIAAVEAGMGISVVSSLAARRAVQEKRVKVLSVPEISLRRTFYLSYLQTGRHQPLIAAFAEFLLSCNFKDLSIP